MCLALLAASACRISTNFDDTVFTCPGQSACPDGLLCVDEICVVPADAGGGDGDGGSPDAALTVCERAAQADNNDGCNVAIDLTTAALAAGGTTAYGDTTGYAGDLSPSTLAGCTGSAEPGPDAVYEIDALAGDMLHASLTTEGWNGAIYLLDGCSTSAACLGGSDELAGIEEADIVIDAADLLYLIVDSTGAAGCYTLEVELIR